MCILNLVGFREFHARPHVKIPQFHDFWGFPLSSPSFVWANDGKMPPLIRQRGVTRLRLFCWRLTSSSSRSCFSSWHFCWVVPGSWRNKQPSAFFQKKNPQISFKTRFFMLRSSLNKALNKNIPGPLMYPQVTIFSQPPPHQRTSTPRGVSNFLSFFGVENCISSWSFRILKVPKKKTYFHLGEFCGFSQNICCFFGRKHYQQFQPWVRIFPESSRQKSKTF